MSKHFPGRAGPSIVCAGSPRVMDAACEGFGFGKGCSNRTFPQAQGEPSEAEPFQNPGVALVNTGEGTRGASGV